MSFLIERVTERDSELWTDWRMRVLEVVFEGEMPAEKDELERLRAANAEFFSKSIGSGDLTACFAKTEDGNVTGCGAACLLRELPSPDNPAGLVTYLMNIFVVPEMRGQGVGEAIVQWLIDDSCSRGITRLMLESTEIGRELYLKMGFVDAQGYMIWDRIHCADDIHAGITD